MTVKLINKDRFNVFLERLASGNELVAPIEEDGNIFYRRVTSVNEITLEADAFCFAPKGHFFPQYEVLYKYQQGSNALVLEEPGPAGPSVLLGVKPCDARALLSLDPVFDGNYKDAYYLDKRVKTTIIGLSCRKVRYNCFCRAFGFGPTSGEGADLFLTEVKDGYLAEALTSKGEALLKDYSDLFTETGVDGALQEKEQLAVQLDTQFKRKVDLDGVKARLDNMFEHPYWERLARKCLTCGICTFVCPTCHCFDIIDENGGGSNCGSRLRCWDACMFTDFTLHTSGHNPRPGKKERVRNRFMHKLKYHLDRYRVTGCVGCGRCIEKCPVNMDIIQVIAEIKEVG
ncbi:MAG: 4Fe-4S dicluster domain-containing protein [Peptococcaceae bacterium]|nr:4Fe-4S dicluster domain-containing protein [Peptococcaceae bacterium]